MKKNNYFLLRMSTFLFCVLFCCFLNSTLYASENRYFSSVKNLERDVVNSKVTPHGGMVKTKFSGGSKYVTFDDSIFSEPESDSISEIKRLYGEEAAVKKMTLDVKEIELNKVFRMFSEWTKKNIVLDPNLGDTLVTLHLKDVTIAEAMNVVMNSFSLKQAEFGDTIFVAANDKIDSMDAVTKTIRLKNIQSTNIQGLLKKIIDNVSSDEETNSIVLTGTPSQIEKAMDIIEQVDKAQRQVIMNAKVVELNHDFDKVTGVDWTSQTSVDFKEREREDELTGPLGRTPSAFKIYRLARTNLNFEVTLNHLLETNNAKLLANPKIAAVTGKEASIFIGEQVPYEITLSSGGTQTTEVRYVDAGVKLNLQPSIIEKDYVVVTIAPEVSYISGWAGGDKYPIVSTRKAEASMRVHDGETFVLGGLLSEEDSVTIRKVPFFSKLPFFGNAFKSEKKTTVSKEIIITVTPQIFLD